jgi:hypothetical protein
MPEIDTDLFQFLSLIGLGLVIIIGLAILAALGRVRKSLDKATEPGPSAAPTPQHYEAPAGGMEAAAAEMPDAAAAEPQPVEQSAEPVATAGPDEVAGAEPGVVSAEQLTPEPEVAATTPAEAEPEPVEHAAGVVEEPAAVGASAEAAEPEEQPFQRGGRWWFRRGDELLVYDDDTGQWQQAPPEAAPSARSQGPPTTFGDLGQDVGTEEIPLEEETAQGGSFWKCPACGAVNGSTATSCRMCFTAKP